MTNVLTIEEVAESLHMSKQSVREHIKRGHFKDFAMAIPSLSGRSYRYIISKEKFEERMGKNESN